MSEDRTEDAYVITAAIAHADDSLGRSLIGDTDTGSKVMVADIGVASHVDALLAGNTSLAGSQVNPSALVFARSRLWKKQLPAQSVVESQFRRDAPRIFAVKEQPGLSLVGVRRGANIPAESAGETEEESCDAGTAVSSGGAANRDVILELKLAGSM